MCILTTVQNYKGKETILKVPKENQIDIGHHIDIARQWQSQTSIPGQTNIQVCMKNNSTLRWPKICKFYHHRLILKGLLRIICCTKANTLITTTKSTQKAKTQKGFLGSVRRKVKPRNTCQCRWLVVDLENQRKSIRAFNISLIIMSISNKPSAFLIYQQ